MSIGKEGFFKFLMWEDFSDQKSQNVYFSYQAVFAANPYYSMDFLSVQRSYVLAKSYDKFTAKAAVHRSKLCEKFMP